jgi:predicted tellurium resistance membrane protein TerC
MELLADPNAWIAFLTLLALEIVLGIDNIVILAILASRLPVKQQPMARRVGLALAMLMRIALLFALSWLISLTEPLFSIIGQDVSARDLILIGGGLFLLVKSTREIHHRLEGQDETLAVAGASSFMSVILQIVMLDIVFSLDSVITAVGMVDQIEIMVAAVVGAVAVMMVFVNPVSEFIEHHPTVTMLALSFLMLIGVALIAEGFHQHIPKGYIYFGMAFSIFVEMLNIKVRKRRGSRTRSAK